MRPHFFPLEAKVGPGGSARRRGFTLLQLLVVMGIVSVLMAVLLPAFARVRESSRRARCDTNLKMISLALDTFRQENGHYPAALSELTDKGYLSDASVLHCPDDPRETGTYADYYVLRSPDDLSELPMLVCPFHEQNGEHGVQARIGRFTTEFETRPATLTGANDVVIFHPGVLAGVPGYSGMELHGGDRITTGRVGAAQVTFADGTLAELQPNSDITVLQSFVDGQIGGVLYTLVHENSGDATYTVNHGSRFDVSTPVATAGARGTQFRIVVTGSAADQTQLFVINGTVAFTDQSKTGVAPLNQWLGVLNIGGLLRFLL